MKKAFLLFILSFFLYGFGNALDYPESIYKSEIGTNENKFTFTNSFANIGIIGQFNGWSVSVPMQTLDGINYSLLNFEIPVTGYVKFRQDNSWLLNWGGDDFPTGIATLDGPLIPVVGGVYNIYFSTVSVAYEFELITPIFQDIGVIGEFNNWSESVPMFTSNGVNYELLNFYLPAPSSNAGLKFRKDNNWGINWGGNSFPVGTAIFYGSNIPVQEGTFNIYFNVLTLEYFFDEILPKPWYLDADDDGFGDENVVVQSIENPFPGLYVLVGGDCDDSNATIYPGAPEICYDGILQNCDGALTDGCPQITTQLLANDCNITLSSMTQTVRGAFATVPAGVSVNAYRFLVTNTATEEFRVVTTSNRVFAMSLTDIAEYNSTYTVEVALLLNAEWQPYGPACTLTTPGLPTTTLAASSCNTVLASMTSLVRANTVTSTISYEFAVSLIEGGIPVGSTTIVRPNAAFNMTQLTGIDLKFAAEYEVSVRVLLPTSSGDQWSDYGAVCSVFTPQALESFVEGCSAETGLSPATLNTTIYTRPASGLVTEYQFRLVNEALSYDVTISSTFRTFRLSDFNAVSPLTAGASYTATVDYELYGFFYGGKDCNITVPGGAKMANINEQTPALVDIFDGFKAIASPNPFNGSFHLSVYTNSTESVKVAIYDMTGRLLETKEATVDNLNNQTFGELYPAGVYNIVVTQDEEMQTVRAIKK
ncbi:MAG: MopE-related protein [Flavobacterium sp.]